MVLGSARRTQIAVITYPGLLPLELIGTVSALDGLGLNTGFRPVTVAARRESLETDTPLWCIRQVGGRVRHLGKEVLHGTTDATARGHR